MIIDDEQDVAHMTAKRLRAAGYEVSLCFEGNEAVAAIRSQSPALILLDIWLPGASGIDLFKELRTDIELGKIPIVFFSADPSQEDFCLQELGADGFVRKPYNHLELLKIIQSALTNQKF